MDKRDLMYSILNFLRGISDLHFQNACCEVLKVFYEPDNEFCKISHYGGDDKNDGYVKELAIFYQFYSPLKNVASIKGDIKDKFDSDFEGLIKRVYAKHEWGGIVKEFYFVVNTRDEPLPGDPTDYYENKRKELVTKYCVTNEIKCHVCNLDYIMDILYSLEENKLKKICALLNVSSDVPVSDVNVETVISFINEASAIMIENARSYTEDYNRISSDTKIVLNSLNDYKDLIDNSIAKLITIKTAIDELCKSIDGQEKVNNIRNLIISIYLNNKDSYDGTQLFDKIVNTLFSFVPSSFTYSKRICELLVIYMFDSCDIFERE